jgi:hypothetical protein
MSFSAREVRYEPPLPSTQGAVPIKTYQDLAVEEDAFVMQPHQAMIIRL